MKTLKAKRIFASLLAIVMLFSMFPTVVLAANTNFEYSDTLTCTNGNYVDGVKLKLVKYDDPSVVIATTTTDSNGTFKFNFSFDEDEGFDGLIQLNTKEYLPGNQSVYEGNGKLPDGNPRLGYPVTYYPGGIIAGKQQISVTKVLGSVTLTKTDADSRLPVADATYRLVRKGDSIENYISEHKTNAEGKFSITNLGYGEYQLIETLAPATHFINEERVDFAITTNGQNVSVSHTDITKCSVTLVKTDDASGKALNGVVYDLFMTGNTTPIGSYTTDSNGKITVTDLVPGSYYFIETKTLDNYILDDTNVDFSVSATLPNATVNPTNTHYPEVTINKYITGTNTYLKGASLKIVDSDKNVVATTKTSGGEWKLFLAPGDYTLVETEAPEGYLSSIDIDFTVSLNGENVVNMYDIPITLTIEKYCEQPDCSYVITPGAIFYIYDAATSDLLYRWEDTTGTYTIKGIPAGDYVLKEASAPSGYRTSEDIKFTVDPVAKEQIIKVYNEADKYFVNFVKISEREELINGCEFNLTGPFGTNIDFTAGFKELQLKKGTYTLTETKAAEGYLKIDPITFTIPFANPDTKAAVFTIPIINKSIDISISKYEVGTSNLLEGAKLELYNENDEKITEWTSSADVSYEIKAIPAGKYRIHEVLAPIGYQLTEDVIIEVKETDELQRFSISDKLIESEITFVKLDGNTNNPLAGVEFTLYDANNNIVDSWVTDGSGTYTVSGLVRGDYKLVETNVLEGYIGASEITFNISDDSSKVTYNIPNDTNAKVSDDEKTLTIYNHPIQIAIYKYDAETGKLLPGAKLELYNEEGRKVFDWYTNPGDGFTITGLPAGKYIIREAEAPAGYQLAEDMEIEVKAITELQKFSIYNELIRTDITFVKLDKLTSEPLAGVGFTLYDSNDNIIDSWETDSTGEHTVLGLIRGDYKLVETNNRLGYIKSSNINFNISDDSSIITYDILENTDATPSNDGKTLTIYNSPIQIEIGKYDALTNEMISGAKLELYDENGNKVLAWTSSTEAKRIVALPAGNYIICEVEAPTGYQLAKDVKIEVKEATEVQSFKMFDTRITGSVTINKTVKGTQTPLSGVAFEIYNETLNSLVGTFITDDNGQILVVNLPVAVYTNGVASGSVTYKVVETSTQPGYVMNNEPYRFTLNVADANVTINTDAILNIENDYTKVEISKKDITTQNELYGAHLSIYKFSDVDPETKIPFDGASPVESWVSTDTPYYIERLPVGDYLLVETTAPYGYVRAESIKFTVNETSEIQPVVMYNDYTTVVISKIDQETGDILAGAHLKLFTADSNGDYALLVSEWTTTDEPRVFFRLPIGNYMLMEALAPNGYATEKPIYFEVKETTDEQDVVLGNVKTKLSILKVAKGTDVPLVGAEYNIYDNTQIDKFYNGEDVTPIKSFVTTTDCTVIEGLPIGEYLIVETKAPTGYVANDPVRITIKDTKETQSYVFENSPTHILINKIEIRDEMESLVPGAKLALYKAEDYVNGEFVNEPVETWVSSTYGHEIFKLVPGCYVIRELSAPEGFATSEPLEIVVEATDTLQTFNYINHEIDVQIIKLDTETKKPIAGSILKLYIDRDNNSKIDENDYCVTEWESTNEAVSFPGLLVGEYYVVEVKAPAGYVTLKEPIKIEVKDTSEAQLFTVENDFTKVEITKYIANSDKVLPGALYELRDSEGNLVDKWTTTEEAYRIDRLPTGKYTLIEIIAPNGYSIAENLTFEVIETSEVQKVSVYDDEIKVEVPNTGDSEFNSIQAYTVLAAFSLITLVYAVYSKKKLLKK